MHIAHMVQAVLEGRGEHVVLPDLDSDFANEQLVFSSTLQVFGGSVRDIKFA